MLQARERVEQMKEEKKKQIEQKFAQIDEKTEKVRASGWWVAALWAGLHPGGPQQGGGGGASGCPSLGSWGASMSCRGRGHRVRRPFCRAD